MRLIHLEIVTKGKHGLLFRCQAVGKGKRQRSLFWQPNGTIVGSSCVQRTEILFILTPVKPGLCPTNSCGEPMAACWALGLWRDSLEPVQQGFYHTTNVRSIIKPSGTKLPIGLTSTDVITPGLNFGILHLFPIHYFSPPATPPLLPQETSVILLKQKQISIRTILCSKPLK